MAINARCFLVIIICSSMLMCSSYGDGAVSSNVHCLRSIKQSVQDPLNRLKTWKFENLRKNGICSFVGIYCYGQYENRVSDIHLSDMGLKGPFPPGLENCTSLTELDLSNNNFSGPVPSDIGNIIPFVTSLDLSFNQFSGKLPGSLGNCTYLNVLHLQNNQFHGEIPQQFGLLTRLHEFNVSNNFLSGRVPTFSKSAWPSSYIITRDSYANNTALCGGPLDICKENELENEFRDSFVNGFVAGWVFFMILVVTIYIVFGMHNTDKKRAKNMNMVRPMNTDLRTRRERKKEERSYLKQSLEDPFQLKLSNGDGNTRDEIVEENEMDQ